MKVYLKLGMNLLVNASFVSFVGYDGPVLVLSWFI